MKSKAHPRLVIVGGGVAGMLLATKLGDSLGKSGKAEIVLVDRSPTHIWKPMLHALAAGTWIAEQQQVDFLAHAIKHGYHYEPGDITGIDRARRVICLGALRGRDGVTLEERQIGYDALVLAVGSQANDFGVPGVKEHCQFIDSLAQADAFNRLFRARILRAMIQGDPIEAVVVGAGATGVELCAELSRLVEVVEGYGPAHLREKLKLTLLESGPRILPSFPEKISAQGAEQLRKIGVDVRVGVQVVGAEQDGFRLADGRLLRADLMVWAAGVKVAEMFGQRLGLQVNRNNQVLIGSSLQTLDDPAIFAIGDCSSLSSTPGGKPLPPTAQVATQQAAHLARYLERWLEGEAVPPFVFRDLGALVSISDYNAFGTLGQFGIFKGSFIKGRFAQLSHAYLYRRQQLQLHGIGRSLLIWMAEAINRMAKPTVRLS